MSVKALLSVKALFALLSALAVMTGTAAFAQHVDPSPYSQHPEYRSAPAYSRHGGERASVGAGDMQPGFSQRRQPGYSLTPPNGAE
jgi:hypothetical protein